MTTFKFKAARLSDASAGNTIDDKLAELEAGLAAMFGKTLDVDFSVPISVSGVGFEFAAVTASATLSSFTGYNYFSRKHTLSAGRLNTLGAICRVRASGFMTDTTPAGTVYNLFPVARLGGSGGQQIAGANTVAAHQSGSDMSVGRWDIDLELSTRVTGASGQVHVASRQVTMSDSEASWGHSLNGVGPNFTFDLTAALDIEIGLYTSAAASASRTAALRSLTVEVGLPGATA